MEDTATTDSPRFYVAAHFSWWSVHDSTLGTFPDFREVASFRQADYRDEENPWMAAHAAAVAEADRLNAEEES